MFVGPNNDIEHFSMDQDGLMCNDEKMKTSTISIKNGIVLDSECKGLSNYSGSRKIDAFLVCSELEKCVNLRKSTRYNLHIIIQGQQYCIEIIPLMTGSAISILKNDRIVDTTPADDYFVNTHKSCFDFFDVKNDIIELRNGGNDRVAFQVNLVHAGVRTQLRFAKNADQTTVHMSGNEDWCYDLWESTPAIKIQDGKIIESACISKSQYILRIKALGFIVRNNHFTFLRFLFLPISLQLVLF